MDSNRAKTKMDAMDSEVLFDGLYTPKRFKRSSPLNDSLDPSVSEDDTVEEIDTSSPVPGMRAWRPMQSYCGKFGVANMSGMTAAKDKNKNLIWQPKSSNFTSIVAQKRVGNDNGKTEVIISPDAENSFTFQQSDLRKKGKEVERKGNHRQIFPVVGPFISNRSMMRQHDKIANSSKKDKEVSSYSDVGLKSQMEGNWIVCGSDLQGQVDQVQLRPPYLDPIGMNIGRANAFSKVNVGKIVYIDLSDEVSSHEVISNHPHSEHNHTPKKKGKVNLVDDTLTNMQHAEPTIQSSRASLFGKEVDSTAEEQGSFESYQNLGWRKAHDFKINMVNQLSHTYPCNCKEKLSSSYLPEWRNETDIGDKGHGSVICKSPGITTQDHISNPHHDLACPDPVLRRRNHSWKKHVKGKWNCNSLLSNFEETSGSILNQQSYPQSHAETYDLKLDKSNSNRCHGTTTKNDTHHPGARCSKSHGQMSGASDNSSARASQIKSDELFARKLQEQFYHEATGFIDMEKVDDTIARSMQTDEDAKSTALSARQSQSNSGNFSVAHLYSHWQPSSSFKSPFHPTVHAAPHFKNFEYVERCPEMVLFDEIRSNFGNEVDLETRLNLLEAMEDVLEKSDLFEDDDLTFNHSFNDTDYEMLLELDESNHQHVGSSEINSLPVSVIKNDNNEEACSVCLEIPSVGQTMRHLPCLHKFHKMCIDTWLKRKPTCPVCKSNII